MVSVRGVREVRVFRLSERYRVAEDTTRIRLAHEGGGETPVDEMLACNRNEKCESDGTR